MAIQYNNLLISENNVCILENNIMSDLVQINSKITIIHFFLIYKSQWPGLTLWVILVSLLSPALIFM